MPGSSYVVPTDGGGGGGEAGQWKATQDKRGRTYYYNESTGQTTWTKPEGYVETPAEVPVAAAAAPAAAAAAADEGKKKKKSKKKKKKEKGVPEPAELPPVQVAAAAGAPPTDFESEEAAALRMALEAELLADDVSDDGGGAAAESAANADSPQLKKKKKRSRAAPDCVICLNRPAEAVLYPCGHQCVCVDCMQRERYETSDGGEHEFYCPQCMCLVTDQVSNQTYNRRMSQGAGSQGGRRMSQAARDGRRRSSMWNAAEAVPGMVGGNPFESFDYEGLDEDFESTPWVQPEFAKAEQNRRRVLFEGGTAPLCRTGAKQLAEMGPGVAMYFSFLKLMGLTLCLMSVFALPAIVVCYEGTRIANEDMDVLQLAQFTLGNIGSDDSNQELGVYAITANDCLEDQDCNGTFIEVMGELYKAHDVSYLISAMDFINSAIFLLFIVGFKWYQKRAVKRIMRGAVNVEDYSVFVTGLPSDATEGEVAAHFSKLYPLDGKDHKGRDPHHSIDGIELDKEIVFEPVGDVTHVGKSGYMGLWVADVSIVHPDGKAIRHFSSRMDLLGRLRTARARVKMYSEGTVLRSGPDEKRRRKAMKEAMMLGAEFDTLTQAVADEVGQMDDVCIGAFVTFNHVQSRERALHDFSGTRRLLQSAEERFRGKHTLHVERAPPPSNILWENIEESRWSLSMRRGLTTMATVLLLCVSLALVGAAQRKQQEFNDDVPDLEKCDEAVPALFFDGYNFLDRHEAAGLSTSLKLQRPEIADRSLLDATCSGSDSFYIYYDSELVDYNMTACDWDRLCPDPTALPSGGVCPCYSSTTDAMCSTLPALYPDDADKASGRSATTFAATTITGCYCWRALQDYISESGPWSGAQEAYDLEADVCADFLLGYLGAQSLALGAISVVGITNIVMRQVLMRFSDFERHASRDAAARASMVKVWFGMLINTALTVVIVNVRAPDWAPGFLTSTLLAGDISDFNAEWYARVGSSICMTFIINVIAPHVEPLIMFLVKKPLERRRAEKAIQKGHPTTVTQLSLNQLDEGPRFDIAYRYASLLNTLYVCMIYSSGMPLLVPLAAVSFVGSYWVDKLLLLRLYNRPPAFKDTLTGIARVSLPFALVMHLSVCIWTFGNNELLASNVLNPEWLSGEAGAGDGEDLQATYEQLLEDSQSYDKIGLVPRIVRNNVFPHFVLLAVLLVSLTLVYTAGPVLNRIGRFVAHTIAKAKTHLIAADDGSGAPPYTEKFEVRVDNSFKGAAKLSELEASQGWRVAKAEKFHGKTYKDAIQLKHKVWLESEIIDNVPHTLGDLKRTWEVIRDSALHSFRIQANPQYMLVMQLQKETRLDLEEG